eukprot:1019963-Pleurochrysis_carterae.AAC.1
MLDTAGEGSALRCGEAGCSNKGMYEKTSPCEATQEGVRCRPGCRRREGLQPCLPSVRGTRVAGTRT